MCEINEVGNVPTTLDQSLPVSPLTACRIKDARSSFYEKLNPKIEKNA